MSERLLRVCEVVSYLQVPGRHVYELMKRKALPAMLLHRRILLDPGQIPIMNGNGWNAARRIRAVRSL